MNCVYSYLFLLLLFEVLLELCKIKGPQKGGVTDGLTKVIRKTTPKSQSKVDLYSLVGLILFG